MKTAVSILAALLFATTFSLAQAGDAAGIPVCVAAIDNQSHLSIDGTKQRDQLVQSLNEGNTKVKVKAVAVVGNTPEAARSAGCRYLVVAHYQDSTTQSVMSSGTETGRIQTSPTGSDNSKAELDYRISRVDGGGKAEDGSIRVVPGENENSGLSDSIRQLASRVTKAAAKGN